MNVLVTEGIYDSEYRRDARLRLRRLPAEVAAYTPEWAYPITTIEPETIRETAREMARHRPATLVHPGRHVTWYGDDAQRSRAIALLNALLGKLGRKGGFYYPASMDVSRSTRTRPTRTASAAKVDNPDAKYPFARPRRSPPASATRRSPGSPIRSRAGSSTPRTSCRRCPTRRRRSAPSRKLDLMVVVDVIPQRDRRLGRRRAAGVGLPRALRRPQRRVVPRAVRRAAPAGGRSRRTTRRPNWWIARELAMKLGLGAYYPWKNVEEYLETRLAGSGLSARRAEDDADHRGRAARPIYVEEGHPLSFSDALRQDRVLVDPAGREAGSIPVPRYTPHRSRPPATSACSSAGRRCTPSAAPRRTRCCPRRCTENEVWVNADVARRLGLETGDQVRLRNQDGVRQRPVKVKATERIRTDCVYLVHGFGHTRKGA